MDEQNNNQVQGNNENQENNNQVQGNNGNEENNSPIQEVNNNQGNGQVNNSKVGQSNSQQQYNNYAQNLNSANGNKKKKSKAPIIIIVVVIVLLLFGCLISGVVFLGIKFYNDNIKNEITGKNSIVNDVRDFNTTSKNNTIRNNTSNTIRNSLENNTIENKGANNVVTGDAKTSTKEAPLTKGEWGTAAKYSTETKGYENVNVKVTNFIRGEDAKKAVQEYMTSGSSIYKYQEPKEGLEWLVIDYDVDFADYTMSSIGANGDVSGKVEGLTSSSIKYNGTTYITSTIFIGPKDYVKTKNTTGRLATQVPVGCSDYIVTFGAYNETKAYFKGE